MPGHFGGSTSSGGGRTDSQSQYGGGSYDSSQNQSNRGQSYGGGDGGNNNSGVDVGFQEALRKQAIQQSNPVFGDPDPQVDVSPQDRDSITSFLDNYVANVKANPLSLGLAGALTTLYQTNKARNMLLDTPGYEFLNDYSISDDGTISGGNGSNEVINKIVSQLPYTITDSTPQKSIVNEYFANANLGSQLSSDLQTRYNNAKSNLNNILSIQSVEDQFGYIGQPNLLNLNLTGLI